MDSGVAYWFVGALWGGNSDQTPRFLDEGIWENGYDDKYHDLVKTVQPGDLIAIKAAYTQKKNLPFPSNGSTASVMSIKARGTVISNEGDGKKIHVEWEPLTPEKKWYFFTHRGTIWRVEPDRWLSKNLIEFTFNDAEQDYDRFRNDPYWKERFGDNAGKASRFPWTGFYEEFASKLLEFKGNRSALTDKLHEISSQVDGLSHLNDKGPDGEAFPLEDICPFTLMGTFNRGITDSNRRQIASKLAILLGVEADVPISFDGIPVLNNQKSWFFTYSYERNDSDIDILWDVFEKAIAFADGDSDELSSNIVKTYDAATQVKQVGWNLTMGLYWIRPWTFLPLDGNSQAYVTKKLSTTISKNGPKGRCNANDYFKVLQAVESRFKEETYPVHSFPELSLEAWRYQPPSEGGQSAGTWKAKIYELIKTFCRKNNSPDFTRKDFLKRYQAYLEELYPTNSSVPATINRRLQELRDDDILEFVSSGHYRWLEYESSIDEKPVVEEDHSVTAAPYGILDILKDGCFLNEDQIKGMLSSLKRKKNIVLQGPPGTGKTWLAKRLAYALIGQRVEERVRAVQFHPNLSYEDFIRGWRPAGNGGLQLVDGPFLEMVYLAQNNPDKKHIIVIEEVNRGNPAQIFGEMLTLLEADKRTPDEALELSYGTAKNKRVYIPDNLYVIGTMNIADRSLALVDLALRRRFAFIDLEPQLGESWRSWLATKFNFSLEILLDLEQRILKMNNSISDDPLLGAQFKVGHSYVTPSVGSEVENVNEWFIEVAETEIYPLLQEYYFDAPTKAVDMKNELLEGW